MDINKKLNRRIGQLIKQTDRLIARQYSHTLANLRLMLGEYFEKYEQGGELTLEEMAKYKRIERMYSEIKQHASVNYKELDKVLEKALKDVYNEGYYMTTWGVQNEIEKLIPTNLRADQVLASVRNPISGLTLSTRLEKNRTMIEYKIREVVTQGLVKGATYKTMMQDISDAVNNDKVKAMRIARTEAHRVSEEGKQDARDNAAANGIVLEKEWLSGGDERVRDSHRALDGKKVPNDKPFEINGNEAMYPGGFGVAEEDINCRCTVIQSVKDVKSTTLEDVKSMSYEKYLRGGKRK